MIEIYAHYSFSRSKYFHLLIAPIEGFISLIDEIDWKIDDTAKLFLLVQNRQQTHGWTLIGSGANGLGIQDLENSNPPWRVILNKCLKQV